MGSGDMNLPKQHYLSLRKLFGAAEPAMIIVAESPPQSGKYFYDPDGASTEPLFSALMKHAGWTGTSKADGLEFLKRKKWVLVDATYEPVNAYDAKSREATILRDYAELRADLIGITPDKAVPILLIKENICRRLEPKLTSDGFTVLNAGRTVYFPSHGRQSEFHRQFSEIISL